MKTPDDEFGWYSGKQMFMMLPMGDMAQVKNNQLGAFLRSLKIQSHGGLVSRSVGWGLSVPLVLRSVIFFFKV
jgi:hypothetical protein